MVNLKEYNSTLISRCIFLVVHKYIIIYIRRGSQLRGYTHWLRPTTADTYTRGDNSCLWTWFIYILYTSSDATYCQYVPECMLCEYVFKNKNKSNGRGDSQNKQSWAQCQRWKKITTNVNNNNNNIKIKKCTPKPIKCVRVPSPPLTIPNSRRPRCICLYFGTQ